MIKLDRSCRRATRVASLALLAILMGCGSKSDGKPDAQSSGAPSASAAPSSKKPPQVGAVGSGEAADGEGDKTEHPKAPSGESGTTNHLAALGPAVHTAKDWKLATDSFSFRNYGPGMADLGIDEMQRLCGPKACAESQGGKCALTPAMEELQKQLNQGVGNGHCEGMAILSELMERGVIDPKKFGGDNAQSLKLEGNEPLQHELAYWWATQTVSPVGTTRHEGLQKMSPKDVVEAIKEGIEKDQPVTLAFWMRNMTAGHATTPFGIADKGDGVVWILHYDNNYPGEERHIEVNTEKNTWKYSTSANPNQASPDDYEGDAETHSIVAVPLQVRTGELACAIAQGDVDGAGSTGSAGGGMRAIFVDGHGKLLITDEAGHKLGHSGGKLVSEIPGAYFEVLPAGDKDEEPVYYVPQGKKLTITLDGAGLSKDESDAVALIGPGYTLAVEDIDLQPNEKDTIELAGDWSEIAYTTEAKETPTLRLGVSTSGPDYEMAVKLAGDKPGQKVSLGIDVPKKTFALLVHGSGGSADYSVDFERLDEKGKAEFTHKGLSAGDDKAVIFEYGAWTGDKAPLKVSVGGEEKDIADEE